MCRDAKFVSGEWVPLFRAWFAPWRIKRVVKHNGKLMAYLRTSPVLLQWWNLGKPSQWSGK